MNDCTKYFEKQMAYYKPSYFMLTFGILDEDDYTAAHLKQIPGKRGIVVYLPEKYQFHHYAWEGHLPIFREVSSQEAINEQTESV